MLRCTVNPDPVFREVIGAWVLCLALAAACFTLLAATTPQLGARPQALISLDPVATVAAADANANAQGRC